MIDVSGKSAAHGRQLRLWTESGRSFAQYGCCYTVLIDFNFSLVRPVVLEFSDRVAFADGQELKIQKAFLCFLIIRNELEQ